ncbi:reverse transcriptase [Plakobranchus ocellatus]|uniref:Reverse transcriptase n=1 Tax=Plakobranchus ocellatus TaxID=259542 RepID=A0AAV4CZT0_9GAST|nr:reverse transcriptase [Plakobranchus ocellatus]
MTDNVRSEIKHETLQLASEKAVPVTTTCAALGDPKRAKDLCVPILRGKIGGREVDVMQDNGCERVVVRGSWKNINLKQVILPKLLRRYVISVAHDSITDAHLGIKQMNDKILNNLYWPGMDGDVTRYCWSYDVCQHKMKKVNVPIVPLEKILLIVTPFKRVAIDIVGTINHQVRMGTDSSQLSWIIPLGTQRQFSHRRLIPRRWL